MGWLVWLFPAYRRLFVETLQLRETIREQDRVIRDLERQLAVRPEVPPTLNLTDFEKLFVDQPYEGGKIPDEAWLTPGEPDR